MIGQLLADAPPGTHPIVTICGGGGFLCTYDLDTVISSGIAVAVTLAIGFLLMHTLRSGKPGRLQMVFELFLGYVRNLIRETVGEDVPAFLLPLAATIGFFILVANWLDFFPLQQPVEPANADLNLPLAMGLIVFLMAQGYAIRVRGLGGYFRHYLRPPFPPLTIIEELVKPITLALRLFGNVFAAVVMVYLLGSLFEAWVGKSLVFTALTVFPLAFMTVWKLFDVLVIGTIQAFIFMLLTVIYFGQAREGVSDEGHEARSPA
jgi:F-type H+-transporting ATPase subunit a